MINLRPTSQVGFREKRMVFNLDSTSSGEIWRNPDPAFRVAGVQPVLRTSELQARSVQGAVTYGLDSSTAHVFQRPTSLDSDTTLPEPEIAIATAETHQAFEALAVPEPTGVHAPAQPARMQRVESPSIPPAAQPAVEFEGPAAAVSRAVEPAASAPARMVAKPTPAFVEPKKQGFFSRLFGKPTPPHVSVDQNAIAAAPNAPQRFSKVSQTTHSDVLFADNVKEGQTKVLESPTLTDRITRANSNDIFAQIKARNPELKIGFDGRIEGLNIMQRLSFGSKLKNDPVLAACVHELQRRADHVQLVTQSY